MSGFSEHWLAMRESADHRSRRDFTESIASLRARNFAIVDLGCGSGSNLRFLGPRLGPGQNWTCVDNDARLLQSLKSYIDEARSSCDSVTVLEADLACDVASLVATACRRDGRQHQSMVTASALLDLVSAHWIEALAAAGGSMRAYFWLALSYDGRLAIDPGHAEDAELSTLVNAHQRIDKGFGAALGPHAHAFAATTLTGHGYAVHEATSDWLLGPDDAALVTELMSGWLAAAREISGNHHALSDWEARRSEQLAAGTLHVRVGHRDLLAIPAVSN